MRKIKDYLIKRPMLLCGALCMIFSVIGQIFGLALPIFALISIALICVGLAFKGYEKLIISGLFTAIMIISFIFTSSNAQKLQRLDGQTVSGKFVVSEITYKSAGYCRADIEVKSCDALKNGVKLNVAYYDEILNSGDIIGAEIELQKIDEIYKQSYFSKGVFLEGTLKKSKKFAESDFVLSAVGKVRKYISNSFFKHMGQDEASTMCAVTFGDKSYFSPEFYENVKRAGVSHVMVVSGMHLSITVAFIMYLIEKVLYNRYLKALLQIVAVALMSALCGFTMSILRAGVMYLLMSAALILKRPSSPENTLGTAVCGILIFSPFAAANLSFVLSVLSTFGILSVALPISTYLRTREIIKRDWVNDVVSAVLISLSAMILTLPVAIKVFGYVSVVGIITNLLISLAVTISLWVAIAALIFNLFLPFVADVLFAALNVVVKYINFVINELGSLSFSVVLVDEDLWIVATALIIIMFLCLLTCKKRIDMLKLEEMRQKIIREGGAKLKWQ